MKNISTRNTQPVYVITKYKFDLLFRDSSKFGIPHPNEELYLGYWGKLNSIEDYHNMLDSVKFDDNNEALVSKVMEAFNSNMSNKLSPNANGRLNYMKSIVKKNRTLKTKL